MIGVELNFSKWAKQFEKASAYIEKGQQKALKIAATKVYTRIIGYTPVGKPSLWAYPHPPKGYVPGTLKKAWKISFEPSVITIYNETIYAQRVENGWSTQAPTGMMRRGLMEFPDLLKQALSGIKF